MSISLGSTEKIALFSKGYFPIVGKYGNSKVFQPGTRGTVFTDTTKNIGKPTDTYYMPHFAPRTLSSSTTMEYKIYDVDDGYTMVEVGKTGSIFTQSSNVEMWGATASTLLGKDSYWAFPHKITFSGYSAGWKLYSSFAGDKPYTGSLSVYNLENNRCITTTDIAYKSEYYVIMTGTRMDANVSCNPSDYVKQVVVPIAYEVTIGTTTTTAYKYETLTLQRSAGFQHINLHGYAIWSLEESWNIPAYSAIGAPLIEFYSSLSLMCNKIEDISVQFVLVLKAD